MKDQPVDDSVARDYQALAWRALDDALERSHAFERRASALLSTVSGSLAVLIAVLGLFGSERLSTPAKWSASLGLLLLVACAVLSILTMRPVNITRTDNKDLARRWRQQQDQPDLNTQIVSQSVTDMLSMVPIRPGKQSSVILSAEHEARTRANFLTAAMWVLVAALACLSFTGWAVLWVRM